MILIDKYKTAAIIYRHNTYAAYDVIVLNPWTCKVTFLITPEII
jgi:hypothetical protein